MSVYRVGYLAGSDVRRLESLAVASPQGSVFCAPSWYEYIHHAYKPVGAYKGEELIAGLLLPEVGGRIPAVVPGTPWSGPICRTSEEGECLEVASRLAEFLRGQYGEASLTLPPEWTDIRGFLWNGWRSHVRYTYRGWGKAYEKRVALKDTLIFRQTEEHGDWSVTTYGANGGKVTAIHDWKHAYYWKAEEGGKYHAECIDAMIRDAHKDGRGFDMVGCNSPHRALFKRGFGGTLTPYYFVTTGDPARVSEFWAKEHQLAA